MPCPQFFPLSTILSRLRVKVYARWQTGRDRDVCPATGSPLDLPASRPMVMRHLTTFQRQSHEVVKLSSEYLTSGDPQGPLALT